MQFIKVRREDWRSNRWFQFQLYSFGFLRTIWLMLLMINLSTFLTYTCVMTYFGDTLQFFWACSLMGIGSFVVKHSMQWLRETTSKHYALSKIPVLACAAGWAVLSMKDLIQLGFFSISNLPMIILIWMAVIIGVKLTRLEKPMMPTISYVLLCGVFIIGLDELAYIARGFGVGSFNRIVHHHPEFVYSLWGFQVLYVILCVATKSFYPQTKTGHSLLT